jgi:hypothetical protein
LLRQGCYAQLKPEELASVDGVDLVLGATEKFKLADYMICLKMILEKCIPAKLPKLILCWKLFDRRQNALS